MKYPHPSLLVDSRHEYIPREIDRSEFFQWLRILAGDEAVVQWDLDVAGKVGDDVVVSVHDGGDLGGGGCQVHGHVRVYLSGSAAAWVAERGRWAFTRSGAERDGGPSASDLGNAIETLLAR